MIKKSGNLLLSIINNVLDMARIESGMNGHIVKPIDIKTIAGVLDQIFRE